MESRTVAQRAAAISEVQGQLGVLSRVEEIDGEVSLAIVHCPILEVATEFPALCENERKWLEESTGLTMERTQHRLAGDPQCAYRCARSAE